jgi:hypothetical protein
MDHDSTLILLPNPSDVWDAGSREQLGDETWNSEHDT